MKYLAILLFTITICFCTNNKQLNEDRVNSNSVLNEQIKTAEKLAGESKILNSNEIKLDRFTSIPNEIDGCGCSLFLSKQDRQNENYIYADAGNIACVKINGELQLLDLKEYNEKTNTYLYSNKFLKVKVAHVKSTPSSEEETTNVERLLTITKGEVNLQKKVVGYCGC